MMTTEGEVEDPNYELSSNENWKLWCRLCAKEDEQGNTSVFSKDEKRKNEKRGSGDFNLQATIKKYFMINITRKENLPKVVCTECVILITSLVNFTERVSKVQQMFRIIRNSNEISKFDLNSLRLKYDIPDKKQENVVGQQQLPEIYCDISKSKLTKMEVDNLDTNETNTNDVNPLEMTLLELKVEKDEEIENGEINDEENATDNETNTNEVNPLEMTLLELKVEDEEIENVEINDEENATDNEEADEGMEDLESTRKVISNPSSKTTKHARVVRNNRRNELKTTTPSRQNISKGTIPCTKCPLRFKCLKIFHHHMNRVHPEVADNTRKKSEFRCGECSRVFLKKYQLDRHSRTHLPIELTKSISCEYCNKKFSTNRILETHIRNVHINERRFICEECGVTVLRNAALKEHMLTHTDYAPFECDVCKKGFKNKNRLKRHMEIHDPDKYPCPECGLKLSSRGTLNHHLLVHSDEMRYKCDYCGRAFKRSKTLKAHLILHTGLKPYSCDFCDCTFTIGTSCRLHKKTAHPEQLAALEAAGGKAYTHNIPKLEALVTITKTVGNLKTVGAKPSGRMT